ncbi:RNA 2',3'-cyclic phosphodiesterase [Qipengyuania sphaerica]|uniref:RNA 2',3'-cyclic phosphodiesterase n=1 Tax=Qipengyuania sphaerica TaxID=2867243 RepID=UPI001C878015|nr:RNA 2',3'-cyclic phosphodiesterase [Qipengyuania sphaerica]
MTHRLFFGIKPPRPIRAALLDIMQEVDNARWQDDGQLHLTLRYIGEVDAHTADDIAEAATKLDFDPFELTIASTGIFERKSTPTTLWAGVAPSPGLTRLQAKIERLCQRCGIPAETRKFTPHITLARLNSSAGPVGPFLARHAGLHLGPWQVEDYILYESTLRQQGSLYEPIVTYCART